MYHLKKTQTWTMYVLGALLIVLFQFQNCARSEFSKVGEDNNEKTAINDTLEVCETSDECVTEDELIPDDGSGDGSDDGSGDGEQPDDSSGGDGSGDGEQPDDSTGGDGSGDGEQPDDSTGGDGGGDGEQPDDSTGGGDNGDDLTVVSCSEVDKATFTDAVMVVEGLILTSKRGSELLEFNGEVNLNGFEVEIPEELQGQSLGLKLKVADSGHYFVTSNDEKVLMDKLPSHKQHNSKTRLQIQPTEVSEGVYLIEVDWASRVFPSPRFCGLLPLTGK